MSTSFYFNNFNSSMEKQLVEDLVVESIKIYGNDIYYCPRTIVKFDEVLGEDVLSEYNQATMVEMYIKSVDGYEGDGVFLSKFGLEIRDQVTFTIAKRTFIDEVGNSIGAVRPREGDLVFMHLNPDRPQLFQIKYVNDRAIFYQLGGLQVYDIVCELFEYSGEKLRTGVPEIDNIERNNNISMSSFGLLTQDGFFITDQDGYDIVRGEYSLDNTDYNTNADVFSDNNEIDLEGDSIMDWTEVDPFSEGYA